MSRLGTSRTARRYSKGAVAACLFVALVATTPFFQSEAGAAMNEARQELQGLPSLDVKGLKPKKRLAERAADAIGKLEGQVERRVRQSFDRLLPVRVDSQSEDEYWIFDVPSAGQVKILRKRTSTAEVVIVGLLAGCIVELTVAVLLHPLDTLKTRLQTQPDRAGGKLRFDRLFDGLRPVVSTVPLLSVFWAVKDVVRRSIIGFVTQRLSWVTWYDVIATGIAAGAGEAFYWALKTPGQLLKTRQQAEVVLEGARPVRAILLPQAPPRPFLEIQRKTSIGTSSRLEQMCIASTSAHRQPLDAYGGGVFDQLPGARPLRRLPGDASDYHLRVAPQPARCSVVRRIQHPPIHDRFNCRRTGLHAFGCCADQIVVGRPGCPGATKHVGIDFP